VVPYAAPTGYVAVAAESSPAPDFTASGFTP
jgi:hypothetical protein